MQPTPLVGREQEIRAVCELLCQPEVRLVTLTGPAGIGKTRLALQVGAELSNLFADGIFLVSLAPVSDPEQVAPAIIQALGITGLSGQASLTLLKAALKDKQMLLLLDNFEQVMAAAVQVAELLATCPKLKILVTSQVVLRLQAEHEFALSPLSVPNPKHLPDLGTLSQYDAVALFIQRAQAIKPDFSVNNDNAPAIAGICARLDGLPLAIELAAARVKFFSPQALFARLEHGLAVLTGGARDLPARQQTLRGAIAWSYNLLLPEEQQLFRRLAVFVNGCSWEATNEVCRAAGELVIDTLDGLLSLVDKSLLRQQESAEGEPRFWMLQTLREFGLEILTSTGEIELTRQGHADYYLRLAEAAEPHVRGPEQTRWFTQLEQEYENLRAAVTFLLERARVQTGRSEGQMYAEQAMRLCAALYWFWVIRGYVREGRAFLEQALAERGGVGTALQSRALYAAAALHVAGDLAWTLEDTKRAEVLCGESLTLSRALSDKEGMANCMRLLGSIARMRSQFASARTQLEEAAALFDAAGDHWQRGRCLTELGRIATDQGQYEQARTLLEESLALYQQLGDQQRIGWVQYWLARLFFVSQEDPTRALHLTEQSLALLQAVGNWQRAYPLSVLGHMHLLRGEYTRAGELLEESLAIHKEVGDGGHAIDPRIGLARLSALQGDLKAALRRYQECLAILYETAVYKDLLATSLEGWATVVVVQGVSERAARLWGTAEALRETIEAPMHPVDRLAYGQTVAAVRTQLGEEAFVAACDEGRTTPLEQVLDEVLRTTS
jgi:predicted ATPase